jgi:hypothetical protein
MATINNPFGAAKTATIAATGATALTIDANLTYVETLTTLTGAATLNLTLSSELRPGAQLFLKVKTTGTETFTFGTGITAPVVTGVAGKTWTQGFWFDGSVFLPLGAKIQID